MFAASNKNVSLVADKVCRLISTYKVYSIKGSKRYAFNIPIAFDTETTSYVTPSGEKIGWCYIWMFRFGDPLDENSIAVYGRSMDVFDTFLTEISNRLKLIEKARTIIVYVHNLGFDFEFIREKFVITDQLHADTHNPIFVRESRNFEFRDSLILSGGLSLKKIGETLDNGLTKKVGDLDYKLIRTPETPLTETELGYCQGDIDVLSSYIQTQIDHYKNITHIPLTNTGRVRVYAKNSIYKTHSYGVYTRYRELMNKCVLTPDEYTQCQNAFYGGYTHANAKYTGQTLHNVASYDFTSSYPAVMLTERFPMGKPEHRESMAFDEFRGLINDPLHCCIADIQMSDVWIKNDLGDAYLSNNIEKNRIENPVMDNGRIRHCDRIAMTVTDVDMKIIAQCYDWDKISIKNILIWETDYMPTALIGVVLDLYKAKTTLKGVKGQEKEYSIKKGMLNSMYGMCVTRILRDEIKVDGFEWKTIPLTNDEKVSNINKNNSSKIRFLYYPWGVFITAYARKNLWTAIKTLGDDYIYSDTDSIKVFANSSKLKDYLTKYQQDLDAKIDFMIWKRSKFTREDLSPLTVDGVPKPIGVWDFEGTYQTFKTLGSKRYICWDGKKLKPTVAGIKPSNLSQYLVNKAMKDTKCSEINERVINHAFNLFADGLHVDADQTGKLGSFYCHDVNVSVTDCYGQQCLIWQKYGVCLQPVDFTMTMTDSYLDLIKQIQNII